MGLTLIFVLISNCTVSQQATSQPGVPEDKVVPFSFPYDLHNAAATFELPDRLVEISGLTISQDQKNLVAIQDEDGILFYIDKSSGEVINEVPFGKPGDYEGIEQVNGVVYVVKSSSKIYEIQKAGSSLQEVIKHKTPLTKEYDIEGLGYDPIANSLMLACKGQPDAIAEETNYAKAVYHFNLQTMTLDTVPAIIVDRQNIYDYFQSHPELIKEGENGEKKEIKLSKLPSYPSSIAIHPITGHYYVTSSKGKAVLVADAKGKIIHIEKMKKKFHPQPEGLTFDKDGTLYISNEGKGEEKAKIYRFDYQIPKNQ